MSRIIRFAREHIELFGILPGIGAALGLLWLWSWHNGLTMIEVGAILIDYAVGLLPVALIGYTAWRFKVEYWHDLDQDTEKVLHSDASQGNRSALWVIVKDRLEFVVMFLLVWLAFSSFAG
jgi:predicted phosphohydrolase